MVVKADRPALGAGLTLILAVAGGCAHGPVQGSLRAESLRGEPVYLDERYGTAVFARATETSIFLADVPLERILSGEVTEGVIVHLDLLWNPKAGETPMDASATNVSVRYVVMSGGEVGVYGGAGFGRPHGKPDDEKLTLVLKDSSLTLLDATEGFVDLLSPARLTGSLTAALNERSARQIEFAASQMVTNALGRTRLVGAGGLSPRPTSSGPSSSWWSGALASTSR